MTAVPEGPPTPHQGSWLLFGLGFLTAVVGIIGMSEDVQIVLRKLDVTGTIDAGTTLIGKENIEYYAPWSVIVGAIFVALSRKGRT